MESEILKIYSKEKYFPIDFTLELEALGSSNKLKIEELIVNLAPSFNALKNIYILALEISKRDKCEICTVFESESINQIYRDDKLSRKNKLLQIKLLLEKNRFPEKFTLIDSVNNLAEEVRKNYSIKLTLPDELEGDLVGVSFNIRSPEELSKKIMDLQNLYNSGDVSKVYNILLGR